MSSFLRACALPSIRISETTGGVELKNWVSLFSGAALLIVSASWTWLSHDFVYGQGHNERPIVEFLVLYLVGWIALLCGLFAIVSKKEDPSLAIILFVGICARLILLPSGLIQENDVYRYVLDGQVVLHGDNPFQFSPLVVSEMGSTELRSSLELTEAQLVLQRIGYPEVPTIYPPVAQLAFTAGAALSGWNWMGQRVVFLIVDLLVMGALILVLQTISRSTSWLMIYAWNPLVLKETANSAHLDVLVAFFLVVVLLGLLKYERTRGSLWFALSAAALGLAILSKLYPVLVMPACLIFLLRFGAGLKSVVKFSVLTVGIVVLGYVPFLSIEFSRLTAGLSAYAQQWRMNDGLFSVLSAVSSNPRDVATLAIVSVALMVPFFRSSWSAIDVGGDFQWVLLLWFLFIPTPYPWYAIPLVALAVTGPRRPASLVTIVLSGVICLYYLGFLYEYHDYSKHWWMWTRAVEHSVIWLTLFLAVIFKPSFGLRS